MMTPNRREFSDSLSYGCEIRTILTTPLLREGLAIGAIHVRRTGVRPFTDKQIALLKTFASQAVIAIENVRLFKEIQERNAELREAWNIRRRPPKCSASSAARRRTCSRCSTPSSRAPLRFVGLMTYCCDSAKVTLWFRGLILVPCPSTAPRSVLMSRSFAGCVSMARFTFPTPASRTISKLWDLQRIAHLLNRASSSTRGTYRKPERAPHRSAPVHSDADQAA